MSLLRYRVTDEEIAEVLSRATGIPVPNDGRRENSCAWKKNCTNGLSGKTKPWMPWRMLFVISRAGLSDRIARLVPSYSLDQPAWVKPIVQNLGEILVRQRRCHGAYRHVRIHGKTQRIPFGRCTSGLCGLKKAAI